MKEWYRLNFIQWRILSTLILGQLASAWWFQLFPNHHFKGTWNHWWIVQIDKIFHIKWTLHIIYNFPMLVLFLPSRVFKNNLTSLWQFFKYLKTIHMMPFILHPHSFLHELWSSYPLPIMNYFYIEYWAFIFRDHL
jgi:hypothetical protein